MIHLVSIWLSGGGEESEAVHKKLDEKIGSYATGELEHAAETVSLIWGLSRQKETLPPISRGRRKPRRFSQLERNMQTSLITSIQEGSLLRRKYWARRSRGGSVSPVYFPSAVPDSTLSCE